MDGADHGASNRLCYLLNLSRPAESQSLMDLELPVVNRACLFFFAAFAVSGMVAVCDQHWQSPRLGGVVQS
jgi:hypothetical protein